MQPSDTGRARSWRGRAASAAIAATVLAGGALAGLPPAYAITPPPFDPGAIPPDGPPGPIAPMKQNSYCTEVGVLPGTDFKIPPKYMEMLSLSEAWRFGRGEGIKVAVIDTGVTPHPRLPRLAPGGDYVMAGDGLSDCDAHGTLVASMIGGAPANGAAAPPAAPRRPIPVPTQEKPPPPQTVTLSPVPGPTITVIPAPPPSSEGAPPGPAPGPGQAPAASHGGGTITIPGYTGGRRIAGVGMGGTSPLPLDPATTTTTTTTTTTPTTTTTSGASPTPSSASPAPAPPPGPAAAPADAFSGVAPGVDLISIRQSSSAFTLKDAYTGEEDPQTAAKIDNIQTMARAIVHAANMGASVINISEVTCISARNPIDQRVLGAAVHYAAVEKNALIVAAAGDSSKKDCKQNPTFDPLSPKDPRNWSAVTTVVTPSWFSDDVLTVGAVDPNGQPMTQMSIAGPWVSIAAPGTDVMGFSNRDDGLINAIDGPDNTLLTPAGTSFATAIVSGVAALVRAKFPELSAYQVMQRLIHTARPPARGVDNQVGYGVVDPVAALTWDVPAGPPQAPKVLSAPLQLPKAPPPRNMVPVWVATGGLAAALLIGGAVFGTASLMRRSRKQR